VHLSSAVDDDDDDVTAVAGPAPKFGAERSATAGSEKSGSCAVGQLLVERNSIKSAMSY
jgi:hypothetical protein